MSNLILSILSAAEALPEGGILSPKEFLHLGSRAAVDQTLTRLTKEGKLIRIARGAYVAPVVGRFGSRAPSTQSIVNALEKRDGEIIVASGAQEANALGLTTQVPIREVFITSGVSRKLHLGNRVIELKHGPKWQVALGNRPAGMAVRALSWLGSDKIEEALPLLRAKLAPAEWEAMRASRAALPSWMARAVGHESLHG